MANYKLSNDNFWEASGVYDVAQNKTQREINKVAMNTAESKTVTDNVVTFNDGVDGVPVKNLVVNIEPVQSGSGDPSPTNIRPITGWTGVNVSRTGVALFGGKTMYDTMKAISGATYTDTTVTLTASQISTKEIFQMPFKENTQYTFILKYSQTAIAGASTARANLRFWYTDGTNDSLSASGHTANTPKTSVFVSAAGKTLEKIRGYNNSAACTYYPFESCILEGVHTEDDFVPYNGDVYSITFPSEADTVYGGTLDVTSGTLTITHVARQLSDFSWSYRADDGYFRMSKSGYHNEIKGAGYGQNDNDSACTIYKNDTESTSLSQLPNYAYKIGASALSSYYGFVRDLDYTDVDLWLAARGSGIVKYRLNDASQIVYHLDPTEVKTLLGQNTIWADCGDVTVEYGAYLTMVENQLGEKTPKVAIAPIEKTTTASKAYAVNELFFMGDKLYIATAAIASGATFTVGTNCDETTIGAIITSLLNA